MHPFSRVRKEQSVFSNTVNYKNKKRKGTVTLGPRYSNRAASVRPLNYQTLKSNRALQHTKCWQIRTDQCTGKLGLLGFQSCLEPRRCRVKNEKMSDLCGPQARPSLELCGTADDPHHHSPARVIGVSEQLCIDLLFSELVSAP